METTTAAHANNLFPTANSSAPDLDDDKSSAPSSAASGFPTAPMLKQVLLDEVANQAAGDVRAAGTKTERAIAYLKTCPKETAKRVDLADAIGVNPSDIVAYLKPALTSGRIARDGNSFSIGVEPEPRGTKRVESAAKKPTGARVTPATPEPAVQKAAATPNHLPIATMSVSQFSVAVWPDGAMQIHTGGATLELSALQMGVLKMFLELVETSGPTR